MTERLVKEALKKYLKSIGAYYFMPVQMGYGASTIDFFVCHKGKFYGIETKDGAKRATPCQLEVFRQINEAGGITWVENSTSLETTKAVFSPQPRTADVNWRARWRETTRDFGDDT